MDSREYKKLTREQHIVLCHLLANTNQSIATTELSDIDDIRLGVNWKIAPPRRIKQIVKLIHSLQLDTN